jgi:hypothetical protein
MAQQSQLGMMATPSRTFTFSAKTAAAAAFNGTVRGTQKTAPGVKGIMATVPGVTGTLEVVGGVTGTVETGV